MSKPMDATKISWADNTWNPWTLVAVTARALGYEYQDEYVENLDADPSSIGRGLEAYKRREYGR